MQKLEKTEKVKEMCHIKGHIWQFECVVVGVQIMN
uniref:Uncharacterized protein n=1 Tax=Candidatus Methanophaga sp. ANME-1 ERB7 TaxID=2759913 RepID=A0A7G9Z849_9EURY|nr:hypothetical protein OHJJKADD_00005 [Methanosarcinales archaeon ANME-1 ERB7]